MSSSRFCMWLLVRPGWTNGHCSLIRVTGQLPYLCHILSDLCMTFLALPSRQIHLVCNCHLLRCQHLGMHKSTCSAVDVELFFDLHDFGFPGVDAYAVFLQYFN